VEAREVTATFALAEDARQAREALGEKAIVIEGAPDEREARETRFMGRVVLLIVAWSIVGTALGVAIGIGLALTVGPEGTEGMIIQAVSWAIFAHLLVGMLAGYFLLADRTGRDLKQVRDAPVKVRVECGSIDESERVADRLRTLGATEITIRETSAAYQI
jgi:hypothetical protein